MSTAARGTPSLARCAHAVIFVVNANEMVIISQVSVIYSQLRKILGGNVTFSRVVTRDVQNYNLRLRHHCYFY